jgi:sporulation protein YlmC with PRC-barrel domain
MKIKLGAQVIDKNGKVLGTVDHVARDTWSGEIRKFIINKKPPERDIFLTPEDIREATDTTISLNIAIDESSEKV